MTLSELHAQLSNDASYRRAYAKMSDIVPLVVDCITVREEQGITKAQLAEAAGVSVQKIGKFEAFQLTDIVSLRAILEGLRSLADTTSKDTAARIRPVSECQDLGIIQRRRFSVPVVSVKH